MVLFFLWLNGISLFSFPGEQVDSGNLNCLSVFVSHRLSFVSDQNTEAEKGIGHPFLGYQHFCINKME